MIENIELSDHRTIVSNMSISLSPSAAPPRVNYSASSLPEYNLAVLSAEKWGDISDKFTCSNWEGFGENQTADEMLKQIIMNLELSVSSIAPKHCETKNVTKEGYQFKKQ